MSSLYRCLQYSFYLTRYSEECSLILSLPHNTVQLVWVTQTIQDTPLDFGSTASYQLDSNTDSIILVVTIHTDIVLIMTIVIIPHILLFIFTIIIWARITARDNIILLLFPPLITLPLHSYILHSFSFSRFSVMDVWGIISVFLTLVPFIFSILVQHREILPSDLTVGMYGRAKDVKLRPKMSVVIVYTFSILIVIMLMCFWIAKNHIMEL